MRGRRLRVRDTAVKEEHAVLGHRVGTLHGVPRVRVPPLACSGTGDAGAGVAGDGGLARIDASTRASLRLSAKAIVRAAETKGVGHVLDTGFGQGSKGADAGAVEGLGVATRQTAAAHKGLELLAGWAAHVALRAASG